MRITWLGHACFMVEYEGYRVVIDPFRDVPGFADVSVEADMVLCSHGHFDHAHTDGVTLREGRANPFTVETVETFHDEEGGALRGKNTVHILRAGGLKVVHLGDLGHRLTREQAEKLWDCDVLMVPVGGTYTVDHAGAISAQAWLLPRVTIPMHYRGDDFGFDNIDTVDEFLNYFAPADVCRYETNTLEVTADTRSQLALLHRPV
ncbi:MAG: MBL fold metallo-hydrolase [Oscillospiraceae bacterium]|nr:MBL fold metallo-hydrolase [Oscillospiraceae bacterium]